VREELVDPAWAKVLAPEFRQSSPGLLSPDMQTLLTRLSAGREDQYDSLACLAHNAWKTPPGFLLTADDVAHRAEGISMMTAIHTWAVTCVGAINEASPDPRDTQHRSKGLAASSLSDKMTPSTSIIMNSFHVWASAVAIFDKLLAGRLGGLCSPDYNDADRHRLLLCASACYVIAWKTHFSTFTLLLDQVYQCILEHYTSQGQTERGKETFQQVMVLRDQEWAEANPAMARKFREVRMVEPFYTKTRQGLSLECAELFVLRECGWSLSMSTIPDAIDALLGPERDTEPAMVQLRLLAYYHGMQIILDVVAMTSSRYLALHSAYIALCEAGLALNIPIMQVLRLRSI
jgi:hypothetical protein